MSMSIKNVLKVAAIALVAVAVDRKIGITSRIGL